MRDVLQFLRRYWSSWLLAFAAVAFLALGAPSKAAIAAAGFAFTGAAVTRAIDLARERRAEAGRADSERRRDLDEVRRLAYMALAARHTDRYELVATVVNALGHHQSESDPETAMRHIATVVNGGPGDPGESEAWLHGQIDRINAELKASGRITSVGQQGSGPPVLPETGKTATA